MLESLKSLFVSMFLATLLVFSLFQVPSAAEIAENKRKYKIAKMKYLKKHSPMKYYGTKVYDYFFED